MAALAVVAVSAAPASSGIWKKLHRPLHVPRIAAGTPCPTTPASGQLPSQLFSGAALGSGPVYPGGLANLPTGLPFTYPPPAGSVLDGSQWGGQKVLWVRSPRYHGPVLIRGRQLDGPNHLRFGLSLVPPTEMRIARWGNSGSGWGDHPSTTRLRVPGCYGYQIDGLNFSRVIVFRAVLVIA
jgi:hypothetical protein